MVVTVLAVSAIISTFIDYSNMAPFHVFLGPISLLFITYMYIRSFTATRDPLLRKIRRRDRAKPHRRHLARMSSGIRKRLFKYTLMFLVVWGLDSLVFWCVTIFPVPPKVGRL